jgi:hypothetical protein
VSRDDVRRIGEVAVRAAEAEFRGGHFAIVVIVRELPWAGMPINVATNVSSGKDDVLRVVEEGVTALRGPLLT